MRLVARVGRASSGRLGEPIWVLASGKECGLRSPTASRVKRRTRSGANVFKLLGALLAFYVVRCVVRSDVYGRSGLWGRSSRRDDDALGFWSAGGRVQRAHAVLTLRKGRGGRAWQPLPVDVSA